MRETDVKDLCKEMKSQRLLNFELRKKVRKPNSDTLIMGGHSPLYDCTQ